MTGYEALKRGAAILDLSTRGRIRVTGEDRKRLLHAMTTNHVQDLQPGASLYAFFLNAQGRILADANIYCGEDFLLLDLEPETAEKIFEHLDRYIIADDVALEDLRPTSAMIGVEGPLAPALRRGAIVLDATATGQPGFRAVVPLDEKERLLDELRTAGAVDATAADVFAVRLENGKPRYGEDITEANLAQETRLPNVLHFNKGCYLGQEIVERVRSRGHVNKLLMPLRILAREAPPPATEVTAGANKAGQITSAVFSPEQDCVRALAYVNAPQARPGAALSVAGAEAQILEN